MIIGTFTREGDIYHGRISTLTISTEASIIPVTSKSRDKYPDFHVCAPDLNLGAAWLKGSDEKQYLSVQIDDPSFSIPVNARLVKTSVQLYSLIWERPRPSYQKAEA